MRRTFEQGCFTYGREGADQSRIYLRFKRENQEEEDQNLNIFLLLIISLMNLSAFSTTEDHAPIIDDYYRAFKHYRYQELLEYSRRTRDQCHQIGWALFFLDYRF